jgi:hypothetical protein
MLSSCNGTRTGLQTGGPLRGQRGSQGKRGQGSRGSHPSAGRCHRQPHPLTCKAPRHSSLRDSTTLTPSGNTRKIKLSSAWSPRNRTSPVGVSSTEYANSRRLSSASIASRPPARPLRAGCKLLLTGHLRLPLRANISQSPVCWLCRGHFPVSGRRDEIPRKSVSDRTF